MELEKIPHRGYTEASLLSPAGPQSINTGERGNSLQKCFKMTGTVMEVNREKKEMLLLTMNPINSQSQLELLPFRGPSIALESGQLRNLKGVRLEQASQNRLIRIPAPPAAAPRQLIRMQTSL